MQMTRLTRGLGVLVLGAAGLGASLALAGPAGANVTGFDPPPPSGSGGFYDSSGPITAAPSGDSVQLVVTVEQPDTNATPDGSIMLTWNPADFTLVGTGSDTSGVCTTGTGTLTCTYTDMAHTFKSVGYDFTTGAPDPNATIMATAQTDGAPMSFTYSLGISNVPTTKDQCKKGGWATLTDSAARPFKNQGDCVSYVSTGGRNSASG